MFSVSGGIAPQNTNISPYAMPGKLGHIRIKFAVGIDDSPGMKMQPASALHVCVLQTVPVALGASVKVSADAYCPRPRHEQTGSSHVIEESRAQHYTR